MAGPPLFAAPKFGVVIDTDFARFGSKSYVANKITSTDIQVKYPRTVEGIAVLILGLACALLSVGGLIVGIIFGLLLGGSAVWLMRQKDYALVIITAAAEVKVFQTSDKNMIKEMRTAVEEAMVGLE